MLKKQHKNRPAPDALHPTMKELRRASMSLRLQLSHDPRHADRRLQTRLVDAAGAAGEAPVERGEMTSKRGNRWPRRLLTRGRRNLRAGLAYQHGFFRAPTGTCPRATTLRCTTIAGTDHKLAAQNVDKAGRDATAWFSRMCRADPTDEIELNGGRIVLRADASRSVLVAGTTCQGDREVGPLASGAGHLIEDVLTGSALKRWGKVGRGCARFGRGELLA